METKNQNQRLPEVIDAEYKENEKYVDKITPRIEKKTQLITDRKGNKLLWIAIFVGLFALIMCLISLFTL